MPFPRFLALSLLALPLACGSSTFDDTGAGGSSGTGGGGGGYTKLEPAPNVDVTSCATIHTIEDGASSHCSACCDGVGADASSFINEGACTCGLPQDDDPGQTVCASAAADGDTCSTCCSGKGYLISGWVGEDVVAHTGAVCGCGFRQDKTVCAGSAQSEDACTNCCMHEGFIAYGYGSGQCVCTGS